MKLHRDQDQLLVRVAQNSSVCLYEQYASTHGYGTCHLKFCEYEVLEDLSSQFGHHAFGLMRSALLLNHGHEERVCEGSLAHLQVCIRTPSGDCVEHFLVVQRFLS